MSFEEMWRELRDVGRSARSGGYHRASYGAAEPELSRWFEKQATDRGLGLAADGVGNLVAWWHPPAADPDATGVLTGSHLDSVPDGGPYDGPLGVVSALAALDRLRETGATPSRPIGVVVFVEEEGSRFGLTCLGSRLDTGSVGWDRVAGLRDRDGVRLEDALAGVGLGGDRAPSLDLSTIGCFVELQVEQGRDLVHRERPIGVAERIWPHGRYRFRFAGEADPAGTTRMEDRRDPMLAYAAAVLAAHVQARRAGQRATFGRVEVVPGGTNAVPSRVSAWLDARSDSEDSLTALVAAVAHQAAERAARDGTGPTVTAESVTGEVVFDRDLARRIAAGHEAGHEGGDWPLIPTVAGHDAGVLAAAGVPSAMLLVRNPTGPTGISHSPAEHADTAACLTGVAALAETPRRLAG